LTKVKYTHNRDTSRISLNIDLNISNKRQECRICTVCVLEGYLREREGEWRRLRWRNVVDGLHIPIWNRTKKCLAISLSGAGRGLSGRDGEGDLTNVQYKSTWNYHNESPLYNKYILIKKIKKPSLSLFLWLTTLNLLDVP
jgi:hypothetical protein